jgi:hypothetical protein
MYVPHPVPSTSMETTLVSFKFPFAYQTSIIRGIDQNANQPPYDSDMDDEEAYNLDDVSSDVEVHPDELQGLESDDE